jgi:non-ribosomal peptide synthetase component E (peptide arylation enzyme)
MSVKLPTFIDPQRARQYEDEGLWPNRTLADAFDDAVAKSPGKLLVIAAGNVRWTYRTVAEKVDVLARNLAALGIGQGDVISAQMPNWAEFLLVHLAATRLGAITNPLLPVYRAKELSYILDFASTKLVVIPGVFRNFDYVGLYRDLRRKLPHLEHTVVVGSGCPADMTPFDSLLTRAPNDASSPTWPQLDGNEVSVLIFTSGTEASPKGVVHSHNTLMFGNVAAARQLNLTRDEIIWAVSPVTHATGLEWCLRQAIVLGGTIVMQESWDVEQALDLIEGEKCTFTTGATPFAAKLLDSASLSRRNLSSFRTFVCGGATIPPALGAAMLERIGCRMIPCWGMSECFIATMCGISAPVHKQWGTDGRPLPGSETAIFDETRTHRLAPGEVGEIATRGPHVCLGYFKDPERTGDTFSADGWLFSNDLGIEDAEGYLRVVGRKKDIINRGGLKVSAAEIEGLLLRHSDVRAVAVVGVPDSQVGEKSCAFVVPAEGCTPTLSELVSMLKEIGIAAYKLPEYLILVAELPMTPTGKVQKFKLREGWTTGIYQQLAEA